MQSRLPWLDLLRALAIFLVVFSHFAGVYPQTHHLNTLLLSFLDQVFGRLGVIQYGGALGVSLFFLLSGYLIASTASSHTTFTYFKKRFFRIYPLFFINTIVLYVLSPPSHGGLLPRLNLFDYRRHLHGLSPVTWSLYAEEMFYLLFWIYYQLFKNPPKIFLASLLPFPLLLTLRILFPQAFLSDTIFYAQFTLIIFCGSLIYYRSQELISRWFLGFGIFLYLTLFLVLNLIFFPEYSRGSSWYVISVLYALVVFLIGYILKPFFSSPAVFQTAKISYSWYLWHTVIGYPILTLGLSHQLNYYWLLILLFPLTHYLSSLSYRFLEKPFLSST